MDKTTKSELGKIKRLLDSKKALTLAEMTQVVGFLKKHGMELIGFWTPIQGEEAKTRSTTSSPSPMQRHRRRLGRLFGTIPTGKKPRQIRKPRAYSSTRWLVRT